MTRTPWTVLLEHRRVLAYAADRRGTPVLIAEATWDPAAPERAVDALRAVADSPTSLTLVVGLAWLDAARPELPPVSTSLKRQMLSLDGDRWFAFTGAPVTAIMDDLVLAMPEGTLEQWCDAFKQLAPVASVTTAAQAAWLSGEVGILAMSAGPEEHGFVEIHADKIREVRRTRQPLPANATWLAPERIVGAVLALARSAGGIPTELQLLGVQGEERVRQRYRRRWWRAGVSGVVAVLFALWALAGWRERELEALLREAARLGAEAAPALDARTRVERAQQERQVLAAPPLGDPSEILAIVGELLPKDVFVQRAEWDGVSWRIDGSAADAAALIPRLDAHPRLRDVRSLAPSTRFLDGGRQRSSFSIGFNMEPAE